MHFLTPPAALKPDLPLLSAGLFSCLFISFKSADLLHPIRFLSDFANAVPEVLLVARASACFLAASIIPLWQLSTLIVASYILLFPMTKDDQITLNDLSAHRDFALSLAFQCILAPHCGVLGWGWATSFPALLFRAFGALCLGMMVHRPLLALSEFIRTKLSDCLLFCFLAAHCTVSGARDSYAPPAVYRFSCFFVFPERHPCYLFQPQIFRCGENFLCHLSESKLRLIFPTLS